MRTHKSIDLETNPNRVGSGEASVALEITPSNWRTKRRACVPVANVSAEPEEY
jgi:hypothetical protein